MGIYTSSLIRHKVTASLVSIIGLMGLAPGLSISAELPVLHLRKAPVPPPVVAILQTPATASAWYGSSPTWFGLGGLTGNQNDTEVLATYDNTALYVAFLNIDRSTFVCPQKTIVPLNTVDGNCIWIQTPAGMSYFFMASVDNAYPPNPRGASGVMSQFQVTADTLPGWTHMGWFAGNMSLQQTIRIPWSTMGVSAPTPGSRWRINFGNYNQTAAAGPNVLTTWAPGDKSTPSNWGYLAFDEAAFTPPANVSPEATLTLRPATGYGDETTLRAGNGANQTNLKPDCCITQSDWNDWDPVDYTIKQYMQFDLSMIPAGRTILSATLMNHCRGDFEGSPTPLYLHVVRLAGDYDPDTATMLTSPLPVENGFRAQVQTTKSWVSFDLTDAVTKSMAQGLSKVSFALAGSSGDIHNGKIWDTSFGRADWYDSDRPRLMISFGKPGVKYNAPVSVGSLNYTSVATGASKNKLTNGTFAYGTVEGISNTSYWLDPGSAYVNGQNVPYMQMDGDKNPNTGHAALRYQTPASWQSIKQIATGLTGGKPYTFSGWYKSSTSGMKADVRVTFQDSGGNTLGSTQQAVYSGSGNWEQVKLTRTAPAGTVNALVEAYNWASGVGKYMLYSDFQLEQGSTPTAYSETMGVYYPNYPRTDGAASP
jgi:hypothetical protein